MFHKFDNVNLQSKLVNKFSNLFYIEIDNHAVKLVRLDSCGMISYKFNTFLMNDIVQGDINFINRSGLINMNIKSDSLFNKTNIEGLLINHK